jgi:hypothetical protein
MSEAGDRTPTELRESAQTDPDFAPIRGDPRFPRG